MCGPFPPGRWPSPAPSKQGAAATPPASRSRGMPRILSDESLDTLFRNATAQPVWLDRPVGDTLLRALWQLVRLGPASNNSSAARIFFLRSDTPKERLAPALPLDERAAVRTAPVAAILATELGPTADGAEARPRASAVRDGALRGAYL